MKKRSNCYLNDKLCIVNSDTLASDMEFLTEERIKEECDCTSKSNCITICQKLQRGDHNGAFVMLSDITRGIGKSV